MLQAQLVELPIAQLIERINTEMDDNPALETNTDATESPDYPDYSESSDTSEDIEDYDSQRDREDRQSALDDALQGIGRDDEELPVYHGGRTAGEEREEMVYGETTSFYDQLREQMTFCQPNRTRTRHHGIPHRLARRRRSAAQAVGGHQRRTGHLP